MPHVPLHIIMKTKTRQVTAIHTMAPSSYMYNNYVKCSRLPWPSRWVKQKHIMSLQIPGVSTHYNIYKLIAYPNFPIKNAVQCCTVQLRSITSWYETRWLFKTRNYLDLHIEHCTLKIAHWTLHIELRYRLIISYSSLHFRIPNNTKYEHAFSLFTVHIVYRFYWPRPLSVTHVKLCGAVRSHFFKFKFKLVYSP